MLTFPKYQPIWFNKPPICGKCDIVTIGDNKDFSFVYNPSLVPTPNLYPDGDYSFNPFNEVTSNDLTFELPNIPAFNTYFTIYISNKIYVIKFAEVVSVSPYTTTVVDSNTTIININIAFDTTPTPISLAGIAGRLGTALNDIIDVNHGTTSSVIGSLPYPFTIANIPSGSYIDDNIYNLLSSIASITPAVSGMYLKNGYFNTATNEIRYLHINDLVSDAMTIRANVNLVSGKKYKIRYNYSTIHSFQYAFAIFGYYTPPTTNLITNIDGTLEFEYTATVTGVHLFGISFLPNDSSISKINVGDIVVEEIEYCDITEVKLISDNGLDFTLLLESSPYLTLTPINDISVLFNLEIVEIITLLEDADFDWRKNCIRFQITDCGNNVYYSNYFNFHDSNTPACLDTKTRLTWYNKCSFNGIDYSNGNMFEIYVKGFPRRLSIDKSDRNVFISSEGKHSLAYDFSYVRYELKIVGYTELLHEVIEKAVLHSHFYINGERYMIDSDSKYEFGRNINARMTATIELIKDGSELLILDCCN